MKFKGTLIHIILILITLLISFSSFIAFKINPQVKDMYEKMDINMTDTIMLKNSFILFFIIISTIYVFYSFIFTLIFKNKPTFKNISYTILIILFNLIILS